MRPETGLRFTLYMLMTPLAFLGVLMSVLALMTANRLREWEGPVIEGGHGPIRFH